MKGLRKFVSTRSNEKKNSEKRQPAQLCGEKGASQKLDTSGGAVVKANHPFLSLLLTNTHAHTQQVATKRLLKAGDLLRHG